MRARPDSLTQHASWIVFTTLAIAGGQPILAPAAEIRLHVSPEGNDAWSGRPERPNPARTDGPVASLGRARDLLRQIRSGGKEHGPAVVLVRGGAYELAATLRFGPEDGGTSAAPVTYRAFPGGTPIVRGGRRITRFVSHRDGILKADLAALGLKGARFKELFYSGGRLPLARYPNFVPDNPYGGGWAFADGKPVPMYQDQPGEDQHTLRFRPQDGRTWARPREVEVFVFPRYNWWNNILPIRAIDAGTRTITLAGDASYPIRPGDRYFFRNALEELDAPGEWYLDASTDTLYLWPPGPIDDRHEVVAPTVSTLIAIEPGTEWLTIRGMTLEGCTGEAVRMERASHCTVAACTIRGVGDYDHAAVSVSEGTQNRIVGNDIADVGSHGIALSGGDRVTLTPAGHAAENNYIHHVGVLYKQGVAIQLEGVGNRAAHNLIHDGPRMGIMFSGNNLAIEFNHIRHMNLETEDTGAVYTGGRDWISSRGTVIRGNLFHDMLGFGKDERGRWVSPHFAWGVYLDDNTGGVDVVDNIVYRCSRAGLHLHNARDNRIRNNIFADNGQYQYEYSGWTPDGSYWKDHLPTMIKGYESVATSPAWASMRNMKVHPRDAVLPDGTIMSGNRFEHNILSYRDPKAGLVRTNNVSFAHNAFDSNLIWHHGLPLITGQHRPGKDRSGELVPNGSFANGHLGGLPDEWNWQIRPPHAEAGLKADGGRHVLKIGAALDTSRPRDNYPILVSRDFPASPGKAYRLCARMKAAHPGTKAGLMLQGYEADVFFWANWPNEVKVGTAWKDVEFTFVIPGPGQDGYHPHMKTFRARIDLPDPSGALEVSRVSLHEIEMLDEWASWVALGADRRSRVADPRFVDAEHDDFRLRPDSPALALGFRPIAVETIGPYRDELRASWPIVEAAGAREHPIRTPE